MRTLAYQYVLASLALLAVLAGRASSQGNLTAVTYNTYLAFVSATRQSRLDVFVDLFRNGSIADMADVVCLQEVQEIPHQADITAAAQAGGFPYSLSFLDQFDTTTTAVLSAQPACVAVKFAGLVPCIVAMCRAEISSQDTRVILACIIRNCSSQLAAASLSQECINCINSLGFAGLARGGSLSAIGQGPCILNRTRWDFRSTYGLLMLSKHPMLNAASRTFRSQSSFFSRGYLRATVSGGSMRGYWTAVCTHLYPDVAGVPYNGAFASAEAENLNNTVQILSDSTVAASERVLLMGDVNHGPTLPGQAPTFPRNYETVVNSSYCSPYVTDVGQCTFCGQLMTGGAARPMSILDNIYIKAPFFTCVGGAQVNNDTASSVTVSRVFTANFSGIDSEPQALSDHYGIQVVISNIPEGGGGSGSSGLLPSSAVALVIMASAALLMR